MAVAAAAAEEDAVKVCVRVRPIIQRKQGDQSSQVWKSENSAIIQIDGTRSFHFDQVFSSSETTSQVYQEVAVPIIRSAVQGYNGTIFAYGQTSSGKTYTMMGTPDSLGIIPQAVKEVFSIIQEIPNREFLLRVSYMEIYNETVTDLLCDSRKKKPLEIREDINRNVYVADLTEELVMNPEHILQWIKKGEKNRHYGETKMNEHSSRSHTIFRMIVESRESNDLNSTENFDGAVMVSHLNLVDLAGSERASQTGAEGVRLKEGCNINRSLFILGQVIKKLSDGQFGQFINYRDSKLTRILQNSLGGNTKTVIICTISSVSFDETLSTLQFASAAKNVKNKPHVNEVLDDKALLKRYRNEIMDLKKQIEDLLASCESKTHTVANETVANEEHAQLLAVIQQLQKDKQERISHLKNIVVDTAVSQNICQEDQQLKRKRRVTWAAVEIQRTMRGSGVGPFDTGISKTNARFAKKAKISELEINDSVCTEFSDFKETQMTVFEDFSPDIDVGSKVTLREKSSLNHSLLDFDCDAHNSSLSKGFNLSKYKELEQKLAELENQMKTKEKDYAAEIERRESFEKENLLLKQQLKAKQEEKDELVNTHQNEMSLLKDQLQNSPEHPLQNGPEHEVRVSPRAPSEAHGSNNMLSLGPMSCIHQNTQTVPVQVDCVEEQLQSHIHDLCKEKIQMLEQKISDMETSALCFQKQLLQKTSKYEELLQMKNKLEEDKTSLSCEVENLTNRITEAQTSLESLQNEKRLTEEQLLDLRQKLNTAEQERDELQITQKRLISDLNQRTTNLKDNEEKLSLLQTELQNNITLLKGANEEKEKLNQEKQKLSSSLKSKNTMLELTKGERRSVDQNILKLTEEVRNLSQEREQLQQVKTTLEEEETQKSGRLEELLSEVEQLKVMVTLKETSFHMLETAKADLQKQVQQYELQVASLHQEQKQFQQLLQRAQSEKENIYANLQDREKALIELLTACQTDLETAKKQRDEHKNHLTEKVNEMNTLLDQLSSLQDQLQQLSQELMDERLRNDDLCEEVNDLKTQVRVLHLIQEEPEQDELAERTECLQEKNQEMKDLLVNISTLYADQHNLVSNIGVELQAEVEAQIQSISALKDSLSLKDSNMFGTLQAEYVKLNYHLQVLLNKFKSTYRNAAIKEEDYSPVNEYERELCFVQKKNDEMELQCENMEQNGTKWSERSAEELKVCEVEFLNNLIFKKLDVLKSMKNGLSEVQVALKNVEGELTEELKHKKQLSSWLEEFTSSRIDAKKFSEGILEENKRISAVGQLLTKKLKAILQSRIKQDMVTYSKQLHKDLQEKKEKHKELVQKVQPFAQSGDSTILEIENARMSERLKNLQADLKKMQCTVQQLEKEVTSAKADAQQKAEEASILQEKLSSSVTERELSEMQEKFSEKQKQLDTAQKEIKTLREKVFQGAAPYQEEMDNLKNRVVRLEMDKIKLSKSADQKLASVNSMLEYKEERLRKLTIQQRRLQMECDTTICPEKDGSASYPLTCGGSGIGSTAMLVLQSGNAALKKEVNHYKKKCQPLSRSTSSREDGRKKIHSNEEAPSSLFSSLRDTPPQNNSEGNRTPVSPTKCGIPPIFIQPPGKTGVHRKRAVSPSRTHLSKPQVMSPNKTLRHSVPALSPGKTGLNRKHAVSPLKTEGQLFSNVTQSPSKKQSLLEPLMSTSGTLPEADLCLGATTNKSDFDSWWDQADKNKNVNEYKNVNECPTS